MADKVVISLLGTILDQGKHHNRWEHWRPSVSICQHEELLIKKYHLLYPSAYHSLAERVIQDIGQVSPETEVIPHIIDISDPWDFAEVYNVLRDFAESLIFQPEKEEYLIHITTGTHVAQICLFLLTESRHFPGKLIQASPPRANQKSNHQTKDNAEVVLDVSGSYTIIDLDLSKYDQLAMRFKQQRLDDIAFLKSGIKTNNKAFNALIERIELVAIRSAEPMLLTGPTGAGKSQLARRIYELKKLHNQLYGSFVEVNCATLRGDQAMSALFGHKKGSYTGAIQDRPGLLKMADQGICFLDEIAELGLDEQAMLLRAIEEKSFLPLGADKEEKSNFQLICGTNKDLKTQVFAHKFREDLLSRINLWTFALPPLKERLEDLEPNLEYELGRYTEKMGKKISFNLESKKQFLDFATSPAAAWTANFRDLNGAITRLATLAPGGRITITEVNEEIKRLLASWEEISDSTGSLLEQLMDKARQKEIDLFDRIQLEGVLKVCKTANSLSEAGRKLYSVTRKNKQTLNDADRLRKYLARFKIKWEDIA